MMRPGKLYGVGIGPGDHRHMTLRAVEVLREVDVVFAVTSPNAAYSVSAAVVETLGDLRGDVRVLEFSMAARADVRAAQIAANAAAMLAVLREGKSCAFATLGDAMTYSTFGYVLSHIRRALPEVELEVVPGVTSFAALAARAGQVLVENDEPLVIIPAFKQSMAESLSFKPGSTTVLLKTYRSREGLLKRLEREDGIRIIYGERVGLKEEFLTTELAAIRTRSEKYLSLIMVKKDREAE